MDYEALAWIVLPVLSLLLGWLGGGVRALAMHRLALGLQLRVKDIEERLIKEEKRYGGVRRWEKKNSETDLLEFAKEVLENKKVTPQDPWATPWNP